MKKWRALKFFCKPQFGRLHLCLWYCWSTRFRKKWELSSLPIGNEPGLRKCQYKPGQNPSISLRVCFPLFFLLLLSACSLGGRTTTPADKVWIFLSCKSVSFAFTFGCPLLRSSSTISLLLILSISPLRCQNIPLRAALTHHHPCHFQYLMVILMVLVVPHTH